MTRTRNSNIGAFPELSRFYGLSFQECLDMPRWAVELYLKALPAIRAADLKDQIMAASFPHMEKSARSRILADLDRKVEGVNRNVGPTREDTIKVPEFATDAEYLSQLPVTTYAVDSEGNAIDPEEVLADAGSR